MQKEKTSVAQNGAEYRMEPMQAMIPTTKGELSSTHRYELERMGTQGDVVQRCMAQGMSDATQTVAYAFQALDEFTTKVTVRERLNIILEDY